MKVERGIFLKKLLALILSALLLCGIVTPAFAEGDKPDKPELVAAEIVSIPEKNKVVYTGGEPESPEGIVVKLTFNDGSEMTDTIIKDENGGFSVAGIQAWGAVRPAVYESTYGTLNETLYFGSEDIRATYTYESKERPKPDKSELVAAEIVSIPEKNKVVYTGGAPESPDGIVVKLTFSDGSEQIDTIIKEENGSFSVAGIPVLDLDMRPGVNRYGEQEATLYFGSEDIRATYTYESKERPKPDKPELVAAEIVSIPEKNKVVYTGGPPEDPDGIILKLVYSDKTEMTAEVERREDGFFAGTEPVTQEGIVVQIIQYGEMTATLVLKNGEIQLPYTYESKRSESLISARVISVPLKNRIVFTNGNPEEPDSIQVALTYSDGHTIRATIRKTEHGYYANDEDVDPGVYVQSIRYGVLTAGLWFANGEVEAEYRYLSLPRLFNGDLEYVSIRLFWFRERVITFFDQLLHPLF